MKISVCEDRGRKSVKRWEHSVLVWLIVEEDITAFSHCDCFQLCVGVDVCLHIEVTVQAR